MKAKSALYAAMLVVLTVVGSARAEDLRAAMGCRPGRSRSTEGKRSGSSGKTDSSRATGRTTRSRSSAFSRMANMLIRSPAGRSISSTRPASRRKCPVTPSVSSSTRPTEPGSPRYTSSTFTNDDHGDRHSVGAKAPKAVIDARRRTDRMTSARVCCGSNSSVARRRRGRPVCLRHRKDLRSPSGCISLTPEPLEASWFTSVPKPQPSMR